MLAHAQYLLASLGELGFEPRDGLDYRAWASHNRHAFKLSFGMIKTGEFKNQIVGF